MDGQTGDEVKPNPLSRKLKFSGICKLSDEELAHLYKIDELTDEELASVDLERSSLIDDYRHLHELSMMWQEKNKAEPPSNLSEWELHSQLQHMEYKPKKVYKFFLLNKLVKVMSFETDPGSIYTEKQLQFDVDYHDENAYLLPPKDCLRRRLESFYDHLDNMFVCGDRNMAIDLVVQGILRLNKRREMQNGGLTPKPKSFKGSAMPSAGLSPGSLFFD
ncbi:uncharacterized protein LOC6551112 [Drosophila erecta]|uniref:Uncharacterized protein n=1 Tax=Drosophila erecta TaxID=7220 RepID=B3NSU0_DROER|nr:uncharacterized protein LOC6551112 [Drosophila erecta]EDV45770.1 uncharacterized protein Dere_GG18689 [Drosophila erecta]